MLGRSGFIAVALALSLASAPCFAQSEADKTTARQLASDAQDALDKKDYAGALDRFSRADALYHAPTLVLGIARAQAGLGHLVAANEAYMRLVRTPAGSTTPAFKKAIDDAKREVETITPRLASLIIHVTGPDAPKASLDGVPLEAAEIGVRHRADPGPHTLSASGDGFETKEQTFTLSEGGSQDVSIELAKKAPAITAVAPPPAPPPKPSPLKTVGFVALGVGVVGVGLGAVTGILAIGKHGTLATDCANGCPASSQSTISSYHTMGTLSTVGFIVGGVGLAAGAVLILTAPKTVPEKTSGAFMSPYVGLGTLGATGRF